MAGIDLRSPAGTTNAASATYPNGVTATVVPRQQIIDARDYGVVFDNATDDTTAIQAAIDAANPAYGAFTANDIPANVVLLPRGRGVITAPLKLNANTVLMGHGPSSTYLVASLAAAGDTKNQAMIVLKTGNEVQCEVRSLGLIAGNSTTDGIVFVQTGGTSILGDTRHVIEDIVVVGGCTCLVLESGTECRVSNFTGQRQTLSATNRYAAIAWIGGTDHMMDRITLGQPNVSLTNGIALRCQTSNTRYVDCKVYGGSGGTGISANNRTQLVGCEVQDFNGGGFNVGDSSSIIGGIADSCAGPSLAIAGKAKVRGFLSVQRAGGAYTPQWAIDIGNNVGADIDMSMVGTHNFGFRQGTQTGAGNRVRFNLEGGTALQAAFAATYTPDPLAASLHILAALTANVTIANPAPSYTQSTHLGQELVFVIPQDATGGRTVTFGANYATTGAVTTTASSTTTIKFVYDGTKWREVTRSLT